jgi:hypothetical protein
LDSASKDETINWWFGSYVFPIMTTELNQYCTIQNLWYETVRSSNL